MKAFKFQTFGSNLKITYLGWDQKYTGFGDIHLPQYKNLVFLFPIPNNSRMFFDKIYHRTKMKFNLFIVQNKLFLLIKSCCS